MLVEDPTSDPGLTIFTTELVSVVMDVSNTADLPVLIDLLIESVTTLSDGSELSQQSYEVSSRFYRMMLILFLF